MKKKYVSTINDSAYYESDERIDTISASRKQVDQINDPIAETHIVDRVCTLLVWVGLFDPAVVVGRSIVPVTTVLDNLIMELALGSQCNSIRVNRNILNRTSPHSRNIRRNNSWIGTPRVNKGIFSPIHDLKKTSILQSFMGIIEPLGTSIQVSATKERNYNLSCIEKLGVKSVLGEIVPELDPRKRVNLAKFVLSESPKFKILGHPAVNVTDTRNINFFFSARANSLSGTRKDNVSPSRLGYTHDFETMSKTTAYRNHINNSEFETRYYLSGRRKLFHWHEKRIWWLFYTTIN